MYIVHDEAGSTVGAFFQAGPLGPGTFFGTPPDWPLQIGTLNHPRGHVIPPHRHGIPAGRAVIRQEVLAVITGRLRCDLFDDHGSFRESREVGPGEVVLLVSGGHGVEFLEDTLAVEVKQGPYCPDDKIPL